MFNFILPTFNFNIERWKWNKEYRVYVSNMGHFRDEHKRLIQIKIAKGGYVSVKTAAGMKYAHRLVMLTWRPIPNNRGSQSIYFGLKNLIFLKILCIIYT